MIKVTTIRVLVILSIILLLAASELIFQINNNPGVRYRYNFFLAKIFIKSSQPGHALKYVGKIVDAQINGELMSVEEVLQKPNISLNSSLKKDYSRYLKSVYDEILFEKDPNKWGKIFYTLGLLAYENDQPEIFESYLLSAIKFAPEWSYFHIELANYYLTKSNYSEAENLLQECISLESPKIHCQQFITENFDQNLAEEVGFLESKVVKI